MWKVKEWCCLVKKNENKYVSMDSYEMGRVAVEL